MKELNQVSMLLALAARAGDQEQVDLCTKALDGDAEAMTECLRVIQEGEGRMQS